MRIQLTSSKLDRGIRLAVLSDTHGSDFGANHHRLISLVSKEKPDLILLPGDIYDDIRDFQHTDNLISQLPAIAPTLYSSGNHDQRSPEFDTVQGRVEELGIVYLDGQTIDMEVLGQTITLSGITDVEKSRREFYQQLKNLPLVNNFHVVLSHQPQYPKEYAATGADLVISGHAHGGQWQVFGQGVFAPGQGLRPRYTRGAYSLGQTTLVVSPGLMRNYLPRFFNPPTLVVIEIEAK